MKHRILTITMLLATTCLTAPAFAESAADADTAPAEPTGAHENILQEIVVTSARAREENVQTTPIAVTAVTSDMLERAHVTDFAQVGDLAPNLQIDKNLGTAGVANIYLRGFGDYSNDPAVDPHVAVFVDGIYMPAPVGTLFDTWDLGEIQVLGGPQGTLLGKNAPVGAVYVTTGKPTGDLDGEVEGDYGSYNHFGARGLLDFPILQDAAGDTIFSGRVSLVEKEGGNWIYNYANGKRDMGGENSKSGRLALHLSPDPDFTWDLAATVSQDNDPQNGNHAANFLGGFPGTSSEALQANPYPCLFATVITPGSPVGGCERLPYGTTDSTFTTRERDSFVLVSNTISYRFEPFTVTSVIGYNSYWQADNSDDGGTPYVGLNAYNDLTRYDEETSELRISSHPGGALTFDDKLDWLVGGYFSNESYIFTNRLGLGVLDAFQIPVGAINSEQKEGGVTQSVAAFTHLIYHFTDQWSGVFGVRESWDHKDHEFQSVYNGPVVPDIPGGWHNTSFEASTQYQFDADHMAYVRFAQGYESGGFAGFATGNEFNPETNNEYEIGAKTDWLNKRLRVNLDFFDNELSNLQVESALAVPPPQLFLQETLNAGSATVEGMEAQIIAVPTENLTTHLNVGYLHTKFNQNYSTTCSNTAAPADCSGLHFAMAPKWTLALGSDYVQDLPNEWGTATFSAEWDYKSGLYTADPVYPSSYQPGYGLVNLSVTLADPSDKYAIEFYGTNVLNRHYASGYTDPSGLTAWFKQGEPAMWGLKITAKFGPFRSEEPPAPVPAPPPEAPVAPPAPVVKAPEAARQFQVFFDFDKSDITSAAAQVIEAAAEAVKAGNVVRLTVTGHTDTVGSAKYNQALSERRAAAVKGQLVSDGVASGEITATGVGKTGLLVPTADGVREPQNRRAEIVLQ